MMTRLFLLVPLLAVAPAALIATDYFPELDNGKGTDTQQFPLGPIGGIISVTMETDEATVVSLADSGPGKKAGLKPEDTLTGVAGRKFKTYSKEAETGGDGLPEQLGLAILEAQASGRPLELTVQRAGEKSVIDIDLPRLPNFARDFPAQCERSSALLTAATDWLADTQKADGTFGKKSDYSNAFAALALLATGDPGYGTEIKRTARGISEAIESEGVPNSNWHAAAAGIFLAEYHLATGEAFVMEALQDCCEAVASRLAPETGRLGHSGTKTVLLIFRQYRIV
jgi:hypothetical protein